MKPIETSKAKTHVKIASAPFFIMSLALLINSSWSVTLLATVPPIAALGWIGVSLLRLSNAARVVAIMLCYMTFITLLPLSFIMWSHIHRFSTPALAIGTGLPLLAIYVFWILSRQRTIKLFTQNCLAEQDAAPKRASATRAI